MVAEFLHEGFEGGNPAIIIAAANQRAAILRELTDRSDDVIELQRSHGLLLPDAEETLSTFMIDGMPDERAFRAQMYRLIETVCRRRTDCTVRIYGQMVDLLWQEGKRDAAIRLEVLWNELALTDGFSLLCGYVIGNFYKNASFEDGNGQHARRTGRKKVHRNWTSGECPHCHSDQSVRTVRAAVTAFKCQVCERDWAVKRMPLDGEAAEILRTSRQIHTEAADQSDGLMSQNRRRGDTS